MMELYRKWVEEMPLLIFHYVFQPEIRGISEVVLRRFRF